MDEYIKRSLRVGYLTIVWVYTDERKRVMRVWGGRHVREDFEKKVRNWLPDPGKR